MVDVWIMVWVLLFGGLLLYGIGEGLGHKLTLRSGVVLVIISACLVTHQTVTYTT